MQVEILTKQDLQQLSQKIDSLENLMKKLLTDGQTNINEPENLLTTRKELTKKLRVSLSTVDKLTKDGKLKAYRIGGHIRYKSNEVERALEAIKNAKYQR